MKYSVKYQYMMTTGHSVLYFYSDYLPTRQECVDFIKENSSKLNRNREPINLTLYKVVDTLESTQVN